MKKPPKEFNEFAKSRSADRSADVAVLKTLSYRGVFNYPMSFYQIGTFLITSKKIDLHRYFHAIKHLTKSKRITEHKETYFIPNNNILNWKEKVENSKTNIRNNLTALNLLGTIPWVKLMAITGSVAAFNADADDDLDIFIVTAKNRLWLTRIFVFLILKLLGKYPTKGIQKNKICPNLYVEESNIKWPENKRSIYIAHEIAMMHPIVNRNNMYFRFLKENKWIRDYLANYTLDFALENKKTLEGSKMLNAVENILMKMQVAYMKNKQTKEQVSKTLIHFNKNDWSEKILTDYKKIASKIS